MKKMLCILLFFYCMNARAQDAVLNNGSAVYRGKTYSPGDIIHLGYGSSNNKEFSFVHYGKSIGGVNLPGLYHNANADWGKAEVEVLKVYTEKGSVWVKCAPKTKSSALGSAIGNKIFINLTGAVDNHEIAGIDHDVANESKKAGKNTDINSLVSTGKSALISGKEKLKIKSDELLSKGKNTLISTKEKLKTKSDDLVSKGKNTLVTTKDKMKTKSDELVAKGKTSLETEKEKMKTKSDELVAKGKTTLVSTKEKVNTQAKDLVKKTKESVAPKKKPADTPNN